MIRVHGLLMYECLCGRRIPYVNVYKNSCSLMASREYEYGGYVAAAQTRKGTWVPVSRSSGLDVEEVLWHYHRVQKALGIKPHNVGILRFTDEGEMQHWQKVTE